MAHLRRWSSPLLVAGLIVATSAVAGDWSRFSGPDGRGVAADADPPVAVGPELNVDWATAVPFGRSSPVVGGGRVFLTGVDGEALVTMALDAETGEIAWRREIGRLRTKEIHQGTNSATPTPATDGASVYAFFQEGGLVSYDADGGERWRVPLGPFRNFYGMAASPVLADGRVYLVCDQAYGSFVVAFDAATGEEAWRRERPARLESSPRRSSTRAPTSRRCWWCSAPGPSTPTTSPPGRSPGRWRGSAPGRWRIPSSVVPNLSSSRSPPVTGSSSKRATVGAAPGPSVVTTIRFPLGSAAAQCGEKPAGPW